MKRKQVLVVEDDAFTRKLLLHHLGARFEVRGAGNGEEALALVREEAPDIILSDIMMPKMDGFALCEALQADPETRAIITAKIGERDRKRAEALGVTDYVVKPFDMHWLVDHVASLLV